MITSGFVLYFSLCDALMDLGYERKDVPEYLK
jgi:hypothetical protein